MILSRIPLVMTALVALGACTPEMRTHAPPAARPSASLARVLGQPPATAILLLGKPGLDRREGPARQLQFARNGCVLDLFYYPDPATGQSRATYAEARRSDGSAMTAGDCFDTLYRIQPLN